MTSPEQLLRTRYFILRLTFLSILYLQATSHIGYQRTAGVCRFSRTIAPPFTVNPEECAGICDQDPNCIGFSHDPVTSVCNKKSSCTGVALDESGLFFYRKEVVSTTCSTTVKLRNQRVSRVPGVYLTVCPSMNITCPGQLHMWEVYSMSDAESLVYLGVWRREESSSNRLNLVGYSEHRMNQIGVTRLRLPRAQWIEVQAGDMVGIFYDERVGTGVVPFVDEYMLDGYEMSELQTCYRLLVSRREVDASSLILHNWNQITRLPLVQAFVHGDDEDDHHSTTVTTSRPLPPCPPFDTPANARAFSSSGSVVKLGCDEGYEMDGSGTVICLNTGDWSIIPRCVAKLPPVVKLLCGMPPVIMSATLAGTGFQPGSERLYNCVNNYKLVGEKKILCGEDGKWSEAPLCVPEESPKPQVSFFEERAPVLNQFLECNGDPPVVSNSQRLTERPQDGGTDVFTYFCDQGFEYSGPLTVKCDQFGNWTQAPSCEVVQPAKCVAGRDVTTSHKVAYSAKAQDAAGGLVACPGLQITCFGEVDRWIYVSQRDDGARVHLTVWRKRRLDQYIPLRVFSYEATEKGRVIQRVTTRDRIRVIPGDFVSLHYDTKTTRPVVPWTDARNFENVAGIGQQPFECAIQDQFNHTALLQTSRVSGFLDLLSRNLFDRRAYAIQLVVVPVPECPQPPTVEFSKVSFNGKVGAVGQMAMYRCLPGYKVAGNPVIRCTENGTWTSAPVCQPSDYDCTTSNPSSMLDQQPLYTPDRRMYLFPNMIFKCNAEIVRWEILSMVQQPTILYLDVWREVENNVFELIGSNKFNVTNTGRLLLEVEPADRIKVAHEYFVGLHYDNDIGSGVVPLFQLADWQRSRSFTMFNNIQLKLIQRSLRTQLEYSHYLIMGKDADFGNIQLAPGIVAYAKALVDCGLPPALAYGSFKLPEGTSHGDHAFYGCFDSHELVGSYSVECRTDNSWSKHPYCTPKVLCNSGMAPLDRLPSFIASQTWLNVYTSMTFTCDGVVAKWSIYSLGFGRSVYFGVWEKLSRNSYRLRGYNHYMTTKRGLEDYTVPDDTRIAVKAGWVVGIHYHSYDTEHGLMAVPYLDRMQNLGVSHDQFYNGFAVMKGHDEIMGNGEVVEFWSPIFKKWRLPYLQVNVVASNVQCPEPPMVSFGTVAGSDRSLGSEFVYKCDKGFQLEGPPRVMCQYTGEWTTPPRCKPDSRCGWNRPIDIGKVTNPRVAPTLEVYLTPIYCAGFLHTITFWSIKSNLTVYFDIWRPRGGSSYQLIGWNPVKVPLLGLNMYNVPPQDQLLVQVGDYIGVHYVSSSDALIPYVDTADAFYTEQLMDVYSLAATHSAVKLGTLRVFDRVSRSFKLPAIWLNVANVQAKPYEICNQDTQCPANTDCKRVNCERPRCICREGYWKNLDSSRCLPAVKVHQKCNADLSCIAPLAVCDTKTKTCSCPFARTASRDGDRCRPHGNSSALLGDFCSSDDDCYESNTQVCADNRCTCAAGYRPKVEQEKRAAPGNTQECIGLDEMFVLNSPDKDCPEHVPHSHKIAGDQDHDHSVLQSHTHPPTSTESTSMSSTVPSTKVTPNTGVFGFNATTPLR